ncbi:MAG: hypothetical protein A3B47_04575 [Candidatus Levybacteria bacterium RIFCSPLOWO2_01_FULL_39_24]|nr:MAG: hypothetical protein A2800_03945 [Candidatus Levybacteria bacterium RIFCSPHIGHO2_01_FULL_40_16]OGH28311.1 MAG: hypothetical protein A3E12_02495 [Candidatus Levybacteria bacterium RIFCSPHIGHO2_12_FULL_39_9]OGH46719.1 MAG: hypothetical protein A3B47_04575 [Candidatus Levybacteria bacterium RIFCSPLOWO2_01_FULL_39_24]
MTNRETIQASEITNMPPIQKEYSLPQKWDFRLLEEYLLALARGPEYLLSKNEYPQEMQINSFMHNVFNRMRSLTRRDGVERWSMMGFKEDKRALYAQKAPVKGKNSEVPLWVISKELTKGRIKGIEPISETHSHPSDIIAEFQHLFLIICGRSIGFSEDDIYYFLKRKFLFMDGVATSRNNYLAFKSKETRQLNEVGYCYSLLHNPKEAAKLNQVVVYKGEIGKDLARLAF